MAKYQHQTSTWRLWALAAFSFYIGSVLFYLNYKVNVQEPMWIGDYGCDVPYMRRFKLLSQLQLWRTKYVHFYKYRLFYFYEEQAVDPLNNNSLQPKAFDVYRYKRLIRAMQYDEVRDDSFDFLQTGQDDISEYDD